MRTQLDAQGKQHVQLRNVSASETLHVQGSRVISILHCAVHPVQVKKATQPQTTHLYAAVEGVCNHRDIDLHGSAPPNIPFTQNSAAP